MPSDKKRTAKKKPTRKPEPEKRGQAPRPRGRPKGSKDSKPRTANKPDEFVASQPPKQKKTRQRVLAEKIAEWKNGRGRPSLYKPEYCELLIEHMGRGFSFESFGGKILVASQTLYAWCEAHPEFSDAKQIGTELGREWWEGQGRRGLQKGAKEFHGQVWSITMKNRFGYRDRHEVTLSGPGGGPIQKRIVWDSEAETRLRELDAKAKRLEELKAGKNSETK